MSFEPFTAHVELPQDLRMQLHRAQIFVSLAPARPDLLRITIVPAEERFSLRVASGEISPAGGGPEISWLPADFF